MIVVIFCNFTMTALAYDPDTREDALATASYSVSEIDTLDGFDQYKVYTQYYFGNYNNNNCNAIACCNVLSYYKQVRGLNGLYTGTEVPSFVHEALYTYMGSGGVNIMDMYDVVSAGLKRYCNLVGYTAVTQDLSDIHITKWNSLKNAINNNKPIVYGRNEHTVMVSGYKVENGVKYIYVNNDSNGYAYNWILYDNAAYFFSVSF